MLSGVDVCMSWIVFRVWCVVLLCVFVLGFGVCCLCYVSSFV